jgi:hypothetical protein
VVQSGYTWELDPDPNVLATGRTDQIWIRSDDLAVQALAKQRAAGSPQREVYSLGMEWVGYKLGTQLGLPIPEVWLETFNGEPAAISRRVPNVKMWHHAAAAAPMLMANITNADLLPLAVAFDIFIANVDRVPRNVLIEPLPEGRRAAVAASSRFWLIDYGLAGLWFPSKFDLTLADPNLLERVVVRSAGRMMPDAEKLLRDQMPDAFKRPFSELTAEAREDVLDPIRAISDDEIEEVLGAIPSDFMTLLEVERTLEVLKARRDRLDTLVRTWW